MEQKKRRLEHWQIVRAYLVVYDVLAICAAYLIALWVRFDCRFREIPSQYFQPYIKYIPVYCAVCLVVFQTLRLYKSIWRFASYNELCRMTVATGITFLFHIGGMPALYGRMPVSYYLFGTLLQFFLTLAVRFSYRFVLLLRGRNSDSSDGLKRVMLIGGGEAGQMILRDIKGAKEVSEKVCCIIQDV